MARFVVAVTGGIASGKSAACRQFGHLGIAVADADVAARALVEPGRPALAAIVARFGGDVLYADGRLDRATLRRRVFDDDSARRDLEAILHPRIREELEAACRNAPGPYAVADIPLLAEAGGRKAYPWIDRVAVVDVPADLQLRRLSERDGTTAEQAARILAAQATREQRLAIADDVIDNSGPMSALIAQVRALDARYRLLAEST